MKLSYFGIVSESSLPPQSAAPAAQTRLHSILPDATFPTFCPRYFFWCSDSEIFCPATISGFVQHAHATTPGHAEYKIKVQLRKTLSSRQFIRQRGTYKQWYYRVNIVNKESQTSV